MSKSRIYCRETLILVRETMQEKGRLGLASASARLDIPRSILALPSTAAVAGGSLTSESGGGGTSGNSEGTRDSFFGSMGSSKVKRPPPATATVANTTAPTSGGLWTYRTTLDQVGSSHSLSNPQTLHAIQQLISDGLVAEESIELRSVNGGAFLSFKEAGTADTLPPPTSQPQAAAPAVSEASAPPPNAWRRHSGGHTTVTQPAAAHHVAGGHVGNTRSSNKAMDHQPQIGGGHPRPLLAKGTSAAGISRDDMLAEAAVTTKPLPVLSVPAVAHLLPPAPFSDVHEHSASASLSTLVASPFCPIASIDGPDDEFSQPPPPPALTALGGHPNHNNKQRPQHEGRAGGSQQQHASSLNSNSRSSNSHLNPAHPPPPASTESPWAKIDAAPTVDIGQLLQEGEPTDQRTRFPANTVPAARGAFSWSSLKQGGGSAGSPLATGGPIGEEAPSGNIAHHEMKVNTSSFPTLDELASSGSMSPSAAAGSPSKTPTQGGRPNSGKQPQQQLHQQTTSRKGKNVAQQFFH